MADGPRMAAECAQSQRLASPHITIPVMIRPAWRRQASMLGRDMIQDHRNVNAGRGLRRASILMCSPAVDVTVPACAGCFFARMLIVVLASFSPCKLYRPCFAFDAQIRSNFELYNRMPASARHGPPRDLPLD
jgi:hypothetical protein